MSKRKSIILIVFLLYNYIIFADDMQLSNGTDSTNSPTIKDSSNVLNIIIKNADVKYEVINDKDSLIKIDNFNSTIYIKNKDVKIKIYDIKGNDLLKDMDLHKILTINDDKHSVVDIPKEMGLWERYLEPTIAVVSAAIITALFFSIRSAN